MNLRKFRLTFVMSILVLISYSLPMQAQVVTTPAVNASVHTMREDLALILTKANWPRELLQADFADSSQANEIEVKCAKPDRVLLVVRATPEERVSTFYYGLHKLGFYFPHPRRQISPPVQNLRAHCGRQYIWTPSLRQRGFHLHTQHPNEWVLGFFQDDREIARDTVLWLARNFQNLLQLQMIRGPQTLFGVSMQDHLRLARALQIRPSLSVSFSMLQQKSYQLLPWWSALTGLQADHYIEKNLERLLSDFDIDYLTVELGSSELTPHSYDNTISWLNTLNGLLRARQKFLMVKAHVSTGQYEEKYGNFNFIAQFANKEIGVLGHTVMYYGLQDDPAPVYGRRSFADLWVFMQNQMKVRPTWYYPETSYFIGMDIDVPLFLTDYLRTRARDYKFIVDAGLTGHINFTSGQELGYWLFDWTVALQANREYLGDELAGLRLLGEDEAVWQKILDFQTTYIKNAGLLAVLSAENFFDELPFATPLHERVLLRDLYTNESILLSEIQRLEAALKNVASDIDIKDVGLRGWYSMMRLRIEHSLAIRKAILERREQPKFSAWMAHAQRAREAGITKVAGLIEKQMIYPGKPLFDQFANPTSYQYGYGWPARRLHFWEREEKMIERRERNPFFMNIYDPIEILF